MHAMVQGFCRFDNMSKSQASNILDSGMVSNVTIVLHYFALTLLPWLWYIADMHVCSVHFLSKCAYSQ